MVIILHFYSELVLVSSSQTFSANLLNLREVDSKGYTTEKCSTKQVEDLLLPIHTQHAAVSK